MSANRTAATASRPATTSNRPATSSNEQRVEVLTAAAARRAREIDNELAEGLEQNRRRVARFAAGGGGFDAHTRGQTTRGHMWLLPPDSPLRRPWRANVVHNPPPPPSASGASNSNAYGSISTVSGEPRKTVSQPFSEEQLAALRRIHAIVDSRALPDEECAICYAPFELSNVASKLHRDHCIVRLPCGGAHVFHYKCIEPWLKKGRLCPTCRQTLKVRVASTPSPRIISVAGRPRTTVVLPRLPAPGAGRRPAFR